MHHLEREARRTRAACTHAHRTSSRRNTCIGERRRIAIARQRPSPYKELLHVRQEGDELVVVPLVKPIRTYRCTRRSRDATAPCRRRSTTPRPALHLVAAPQRHQPQRPQQDLAQVMHLLGGLRHGHPQIDRGRLHGAQQCRRAPRGRNPWSR